MASNMGIGTARDLAKVHSLIVEGKLFSERFLRQIHYPQLDEMDIINGYPENKGFGWIYNKNTLVKIYALLFDFLLRFLSILFISKIQKMQQT